jgi:hypothetical protein
MRRALLAECRSRCSGARLENKIHSRCSRAVCTGYELLGHYKLISALRHAGDDDAPNLVVQLRDSSAQSNAVNLGNDDEKVQATGVSKGKRS